MRRSLILGYLLFFSMLCFSQQNSSIKILGKIPDADDNKFYQIQVGAFKLVQNAERAFDRLNSVSLNPSYEKYLDFTRVLVNGVSYRDIPLFLDIIRNSGFSEVVIRIDNSVIQLPVSNAELPSSELREIASRTVKIGETRSLTDLTAGRNVVSWISSTPQAVSVDANGNITGLSIGNGYIKINETEYISVAVVPVEEFYIVPESQAALLPPESKTGEVSTTKLTEYRTEPTFRLAYRFNNKGENRGASGSNGGIDILGRGADYEWLWTTYEQGGWFYDLNGVKREMINGFQKGSNGIELTLKPEFVYDKGVPYLQLKHILRNTNNFAVSGQKFGASADVMIHKNDFASLVHTPFGAYMTDSASNPSLELMFIGESGWISPESQTSDGIADVQGAGIDPVDTLWLGTWNGGSHLNYIYSDNRSDIHQRDSAIGFSYQNIDLGPGEIKEFIVRFTLARNED